MAKIKKITKHQKDYELELTRLTAQWQRALADYQNLEKRTNNERQQFIKLANVNLIANLLPVLDDLERATNHLKDQGIELVLKQFKEILKSEGVKEIEAFGNPFDPAKMEGVDKTRGEVNKVTRVDQKGYTIDEYVIRPAKVAVGEGN